VEERSSARETAVVCVCVCQKVCEDLEGFFQKGFGKNGPNGWPVFPKESFCKRQGVKRSAGRARQEGVLKGEGCEVGRWWFRWSKKVPLSDKGGLLFDALISRQMLARVHKIELERRLLCYERRPWGVLYRKEVGGGGGGE
jgi:hypothetical protein